MMSSSAGSKRSLGAPLPLPKKVKKDGEVAGLYTQSRFEVTIAPAAATSSESGSEYDDDDDDDDYDDEIEIDDEDEAEGEDEAEAEADAEGEDEDEDEVESASADRVDLSYQVKRVLGGLGLDHFDTELPAHELLVRISALSDLNKTALATFHEKVQHDRLAGKLTQAIAPIDNFLQRRDPGWDTHDPAMDVLWNSFVDDVIRLGGDTVEAKDLVKPSGSLHAPLACIWEYPTFKSNHKEFGYVHDRTNPSMRLHDDKFGANGWVRTQDRIMIRHKYVSEKVGGVPWEEKYPSWDRIEERCIALNKELLKNSGVIVFVGKQNCLEWQSMIHLDNGDRVQQVQFRSSVDGHDVDMPDVYKRPAAFYLIKGSSGIVKKLVFLVYHSQYHIQSGDYRRSAYTDLMWNAASSFVGVDVARYDAYVCRTGTDNRYPSQPKPDRALKEKREKALIDPATVPNKQKRIGGKAKDFTQARAHCYHVDPETGEQCGLSYTQAAWLKSHFEKIHTDDTWDSKLVEWKVIEEDPHQGEKEKDEEDLADINKFASLRKQRNRSQKCYEKGKETKILKCTMCNHTNANHSANMKRHIERFHPGVKYSTKLYIRIEKSSVPEESAPEESAPEDLGGPSGQ